ncbi:DUF2933 domain-containing protein [Kitasatospora cathayae]|uniref:DUF2933 domain-containing protein n=1 Tax=Kitasatospora cathayae TaxID=3004092 RepID=A0ABY7PXH0_9ACTN|nr:DUF2933 domain-containing protein [Kitasatospora sp. HUAS 3-15]WBP85113.1 DUF2933 domain-containing protein [Kitasatospora sp. HUAS 3-15]
MKNNRSYGLYAIAIAIAFVGALALGVPVGTLALLGTVAVCPLMMFFMMRGMHGMGGDDRHRDTSDDRDPFRTRDDHRDHPAPR